MIVTRMALPRRTFLRGIGAAFALIAYFGFAQTLGINIGAGPVESAIERVVGGEGG